MPSWESGRQREEGESSGNRVGEKGEGDERERDREREREGALEPRVLRCVCARAHTSVRVPPVPGSLRWC